MGYYLGVCVDTTGCEMVSIKIPKWIHKELFGCTWEAPPWERQKHFEDMLATILAQRIEETRLAKQRKLPPYKERYL